MKINWVINLVLILRGEVLTMKKITKGAEKGMQAVMSYQQSLQRFWCESKYGMHLLFL